MNDDNYFFLAFTTNTTHTHQYVAQFSDQMFYKAVAYVNLEIDEIVYLVGLNGINRKVSELEGKKIYKSQKIACTSGKGK